MNHSVTVNLKLKNPRAEKNVICERGTDGSFWVSTYMPEFKTKYIM
jgi:hypothetical protein